MENEWQNTSTVYLQQHARYYRWILYPVALLFMGVLGFLLFFSSEQVVRSKGQLSAEEILSIQIPIEATIKENKLEENLTVKKGEPLLTFDIEKLVQQKEQLTEEITSAVAQEEAIDRYIQSLEEETNLFTQSDPYGYSNQVTAFLKNKEQVTYSTQQLQENYQTNASTSQKKINQLAEQVAKKQQSLQEVQQIRNAWINQQSIQNYSAEYLSKYAVWQAQMTQAQETDKEQVKASVLAEIDTLASQLEQAIDQLQLEKEVTELPTNPSNEVTSQLATIGQTKEQQIASAKEQKKELLLGKEQKEVTLKNLAIDVENGVYKAPSEGVIHLDTAYQDTKDIPKGTVIANIYPLKEQEKMTIVSQIPADDMTHIKVGMPIHVTLDKKGVAEQILDGELTEIAETSTTTEQGIFFSVKGTVNVPKDKTFRYGLTGDISLVIGKKTYWNQLMDFMFN